MKTGGKTPTIRIIERLRTRGLLETTKTLPDDEFIASDARISLDEMKTLKSNGII